MNLPVPVLDEPTPDTFTAALAGGTILESEGEARESTMTVKNGGQQDSRGGQTSKKHWVMTFRVEPPVNQTVSVRFGSSVMFAAYSKAFNQWFGVFPGGKMEAIEEPPMWFCEDEWAKEHQRDLSKIGRRENPLRMRKQKHEQLSLL